MTTSPNSSPSAFVTLLKYHGRESERGGLAESRYRPGGTFGNRKRPLSLVATVGIINDVKLSRDSKVTATVLNKSVWTCGMGWKLTEPSTATPVLSVKSTCTSF